MRYSIGMMVNSLRLPLRDGIRRAAEMKADGIQIAVDQEFSPETLSASQRAELRSMISGLGLSISAVCGDLGGHGFAIAKDNAARIEKSKRILELAVEMDCKVVTTHIGVIPADPSHDRRKAMAEACEQLGCLADDANARFAIETGPETPEILKDFLGGLSSKGVGVNYDPANLVMVTRADPIKGVYTLRNYIVHTHAKDGVCLRATDPEIIYNFFAEGGIDDMRLEDYFLEKPLGSGDVNIPEWVKALEDIGYNGFLTIEREVGGNPAGDIAEAISYLKSL